MAKLLIIDDNEQNRYMLRTLLEGHGHAVVEASNGREALDLALGAPPDCAISDLLMPVMDGFALCQQWVRDDQLRRIPFVVYTATYTDPRDEQLALDLGARRYLRKPVEPEVFVAMIDEVLRHPEERAFDLAASGRSEVGQLRMYNERLVKKLESKMLRLEQKSARERHLNVVLRAIRKVNRVIVTERDPAEILRQSCIAMVESRGYDAAWIAITEERSPFGRLVAERGFGNTFAAMKQRLEQGLVPQCCDAAADAGTVHIIRDPQRECPSECPLLEGESSICQRAAMIMVVPVKSTGRTHGFMYVAVHPERDVDDEETSLVQEMAGDIGFALWSIETEGMRRKEEERFRLTFEHASIGKVLTAPDGKLIRVNQAFCDLLGYSHADLETRDFASVTHPDDLAISRESVRCLLAKEQPSFRFDKRYLRKDGQPIWTDVSTMLLRNPDGSPEHFITHVLDISERKRLQAQVAQSDRLASMGMLAAGVAHEINNPLCYVLYNLESLTDDLPKFSEELRRCMDLCLERLGEEQWAELFGPVLGLVSPATLDDINDRFRQALEGTRRIRDIARGLGTFSRVEEDRLVPTNLMHPIEVAINMAFNEIKYRTRLVKEYGNVESILASDGRLAQVFLNLLVNAAHAIPEGAVEENEIRVRTWQEGADVFAEVRDTGSGVSRDHLPRLFEPFFTTKKEGSGTGLGLAISKRIVESYGGCIEVESEIGKGTSFVVRLPVGKPKEPRPLEKTSEPPTQDILRGRILMVDDEPAVRSVVTRMLGRNHDVVEAGSGRQAMEIIEKDADFDVILCDLMMPDVSGIDLHAWLSERDTGLASKVVFITGGVFSPRSNEYLSRSTNIKIEKPFDAASVKKMIDDLVIAARSRR